MKKLFSSYLLLIILIMTNMSSFSQKQKLPNNNEFFHAYEKNNTIICIYDIYDNLVREAHIDKDIVYNYFNKDIFLSHLPDRQIINMDFIKSKTSIDYLYNLMEREDVIQTSEELGYIKKFKINPYGFKEMIFSSSIYDNQIPSDISDQELINTIENQESITKKNVESEKEFNEKLGIYTYSFFKNGKEDLKLIFKFNKQDLISNSFSIQSANTGKLRELKNLILKKIFYDDKGNITEHKEWRSKNYKQFQEFIAKKGYEHFLGIIFNNPDDHFEIIPSYTKMFNYNNGLLTISRIKDSLNNEVSKEEYRYDDKRRLIKIISFQEEKILGTDAFKYE